MEACYGEKTIFARVGADFPRKRFRKRGMKSKDMSTRNTARTVLGGERGAEEKLKVKSRSREGSRLRESMSEGKGGHEKEVNRLSLLKWGVYLPKGNETRRGLENSWGKGRFCNGKQRRFLY